MENLLNINPETEYKTYIDSDCPNAGNCIGFSHPVQTENGILPCTAVYKCKFPKHIMYQWPEAPCKQITKK